METDTFTEMSFRIGDVAAMFDISTKTLRIYDRIGLLKPSIINVENGYRYYTPNQLSTLEVILNLKKVGFSLKEISLFVNGDVDNAQMVTTFQNKQMQLQSILDTLQYNIELIEDMVSSIKQGTLIKDQLTD
ncbi:MAG: transcriptional regulator, MerR family, partial [Anaerocolumna sp.]|nr:transcriptional regulator, MerR family [Anaerocolumna sp.]